MKRLLLLAILSSFLAGIGCVPKPSRFGIVFISSGANGAADIYRIPDDTQAKIEQSTATPTVGEYPISLSKDGNRIIFEAGSVGLTEKPSDLAKEEFRHIYFLDTANKRLVDITSRLVKYAQVGSDFFMDWSPDEKQFVVIVYDGTGSDIKSFLEFVDFDGTNKRDMLIPATGKIPSLINGVKWSPDGKKFMLARGVIGLEQQMQNPGDALQVYDLGSGKLTELTDYQEDCFLPKWSPTSLQVAVTCAPYYAYTEIPGPLAVRILSTESPGQPYERLALSPCQDPSWSPNGKQIAFSCDTGAKHEGLFIINSDGNGIHQVKLGSLGSPPFLRYPTWSPDGTEIVYVAATSDGQESIYVVARDGSNNRVLTHQIASYNGLFVYPVP